MKSEVFNNNFGSSYGVNYPKLSKEQDRLFIANLFEQLLIFDQITISTNRINFALVFLIDRLGINIVEKLFDYGYIKIMIWSPVLISGKGRMQKDGSIDESVIYKQPPIGAGSLSSDDFNPEININRALNNFNLQRDRKRIFTRRALKNYIVPDGMEFSTDSAKLVIDAYLNDNLSSFGLPYEKEPNLLNLNQRNLLLNLGQKVLETAVLAKYHLKSYENYDHYKICKSNIENIGKAYKIAENTNAIFTLENLPDLKSLFLDENMSFESVFNIRHLSNAKYYRKWINEIGENYNANEITAEYINQIKGSSKFINSTEGKFVKTLGLFAINAVVGSAIAGPVGTAAGLGLGILETFWLNSILEGRKPSIFVDNLKKEINKKII